MGRTTILAAIVSLVFCGSLLRAAAAADDSRPNIIVILSDDQGYGDLGCYGGLRMHTPRIDQMAAEGVRFTDFYDASPVCTPSRASFLTGCYPQRVGMGEIPQIPNGKPWMTRVLYPGAPFGLGPKEITIADVLRKDGYVTGCIGKWHLGDIKPFMPLDHGFDSYFGILYTPDMPPVNFVEGYKVVERNVNLDEVTDRYTDLSKKFIDKNKDHPFFLFLSHMVPHAPVHAAPRFHGKSPGGIYGDTIEQLDDSTGQILDELKKDGIDDKTLVIFFSDNGPWLAKGEGGGLPTPLTGGKGSTREGGERVPCIMRWPGKIPANTVCNELAAEFDIMPTVAKICGAQMPTDRIIDGKDISDLMFNKSGAKTPHEFFYYYNGNKMTGVRSGPWKLRVQVTVGDEFGGYLRLDNANTQMPRALYNLKFDPQEQKNVIEDHPEIAEKLQAMIEVGRTDLGDDRRKEIGKGVRPIGHVDRPLPTKNFGSTKGVQ